MTLRLLVGIGLAVLTTAAAAQTLDAPISTSTYEEEGEYLVDGRGMSLYLFKADTQGRGASDPVSTCNDDPCVGTWPPVLSDGTPAGDDKIDATLLGTMTRDDGTTQFTFNGWPLYYYYEDAAPGDILGNDIDSFGEDWYLVGPHGNRADKERDN